jgi:uncharacterized protein YcnI
MRSIYFRRAAVVLAAAVVGVVGFAPAASAHVTVTPSTAVQGSYAKITFRVPNEKADASTVKVEINLPADKPLASVSLKPVPGWTGVATRSALPAPVKTDDGEITEAVTKITWTAVGDGGVKPGEFQEFDVSLGPLPKADQIVFKALQTYSDGEIVRWIEEPTGGAEPENPAPVLKLTPAGAGTDAHGAATGTQEGGSDAAAAGDTGDNDGGSGLALWFGIAGLVLGAAGLGVGLLAYRRAAA